MPLLSLGTIEITDAALAALHAVNVDPAVLFSRHQQGDWGDVDEKMRQRNDLAAQQNQRVLSMYKLVDGTEIIVITSADRSSTLMLLETEFQRLEVSTQEGYAIWATTYDSEKNSLIVVEEPHVDALLAPLPIAVALDAGAGTGRHALKLARRGIAVTAIDQSPEMLAVAQRAAQSEGLAIDFRLASINDDLPFAPGRFDFVICALALCHVPDLPHVIQEFSRVLQAGGYVLISTFHPEAIERGWRTTFLGRGAEYKLPNMHHTRADYLDAIEKAGLTIMTVIDALVNEIPDDIPSKALLRDDLDKTFCLIILAQKPAR